MPIPCDRSPLPSPGEGSPPRSVLARHAALLAVATLVAGHPAMTPAQQPRPLDPLTPQETRAAQALAEADSQVRALVGGRRHSVGPVDFLALKPDSARAGPPEPRPIRAALVHFYVYEGDYGVQALVDLARRRVLRVERVERRIAPLSPQEVAEAKRIALADARFRRALGARASEYRLEWLGATPNDTSDACSRHRCILLVPHLGTRYVLRPRFIVDLTDRVVRVIER